MRSWSILSLNFIYDIEVTTLCVLRIEDPQYKSHRWVFILGDWCNPTLTAVHNNFQQKWPVDLLRCHHFQVVIFLQCLVIVQRLKDLSSLYQSRRLWRRHSIGSKPARHIFSCCLNFWNAKRNCSSVYTEGDERVRFIFSGMPVVHKTALPLEYINKIIFLFYLSCSSFLIFLAALVTLVFILRADFTIHIHKHVC